MPRYAALFQKGFGSRLLLMEMMESVGIWRAGPLESGWGVDGMDVRARMKLNGGVEL